MSTRYIVGPGREFNYPADVTTLQLCKQAGGRSKLSEAESALCTFKTVTEGDDCSDMPGDTLALYVEREWVLVEGALTPETPATPEAPAEPETPAEPAAPAEPDAPSEPARKMSTRKTGDA